MKLFFSPGACSLACHIALVEGGLAFEIESVSLREKKTKSGVELNTLNPKGYIPVLEVEPKYYLTEVAVILQFIADLVPGHHLAPAMGTKERYRCQEALNFIATEVHKGFSPLWNTKIKADEKERAIQNLSRRINYFNNHLASHDYVLGHQWSIADAYLFTVLNWASMVNLSLGSWPYIVGYMSRMRSRPSVQSAMKAEGLI
jgi:glutathione S-transferase